MGQRLIGRSSVVGASVAALVAGCLVGAVAPAGAVAPQPMAPDRAAGAGIESLGPIATVDGAAGSRWPTPVQSVATLPRGSAMNGEFPLIYIPRLADEPAVDVRLIDLARGSAGADSAVWSGSAKDGWVKVGQRLAAGESFGVDSKAPDGWVRVGTFSVAVPGPGAGPTVGLGGMQVASVTGAVSWGWQSPSLVGPATDMSVALSWGSGAPNSAGLPEGWRVVPKTGSPWARIEISGGTASRIAPPPGPRVRVTGGVAEVEVSSTDASQVAGQIVQVRNADGSWRDVAQAAATGGAVRARLATKAVQFRTCLDVETTQLCGNATSVSGDGVFTAPRARAAVPANGVVSDSGPRVVTLRGWDGSALVFERTAQGLYEQVTGAGRVPGLGNTLDRSGNGTWEFTDAAGTSTRFIDDMAVSVESGGARISQMEWDKAGRLVRLTNEIGRTIRLTYAGECPSDAWTAYGFTAVPKGMLCRIDYPGGEATDVGYVAAGDGGAQIALIKDAGNVGTGLGWDSRGRLVSERSGLVLRAALVDPSAKSVMSRVGYDDRGRATRLADAPATPGGASATRTLTFSAMTEAVLKSWVADPSTAPQPQAVVRVQAGGYDLERRDYLDPTTWQTIRTVDAAGLGTRMSGDLIDAGTQATTDEQGRILRVKRDELGRQISTVGPSTKATSNEAKDVQQTSTDYDVAIDGSKRVRLAGLRAQVFPQDFLSGVPEAEFWEAERNRGGLSYRWDGKATGWSALATGVWRPSEAQDEAGAKNGWTFRVNESRARVLLMVGSVACEPAPGSSECVIEGLPKGPKQVTVQITAPDRTGSFDVQAAPVGDKVESIDYGTVRPEYSNPTVSTSNDLYPGGPRDPRTVTTYADPAAAQPTASTDPAGRTVRLAYEEFDPERGQWGRQTVYTTAGGETVRTRYWPNTGQVTLPPACGSGEAVASGQASTITRQDGTSVTTYYDIRGRQLANETKGDGAAEVQCLRYFADGSTSSQSTFAVDGAGTATLIERIEVSSNDPATGGDPLRTTTTITHGPAAPVAPDTTVTTKVTTNLRGQVVNALDASGTTTTAVYDVMGQRSSITYDAPGSGPVTTVAYTYRSSDGAMSKVSINGVTAASISYDRATGRISEVAYPGATASYLYGTDGRIRTKTVQPAQGTRYVNAVTRTDFGRTTSETTTGPGLKEERVYTYDDAGRLARAVISGAETRTFGYSFAAQASVCGSGYTRAGQDNLRSGGSRDGAAYVTCHDDKGRIVSTTDPLLTGGDGTATFTHDAFGRVTAIAGIDRPVSLTYGIGGEIVRMREGIDTTSPITTEFTTYAGSVLTRRVTTAAGTKAISYGAGGTLQLVTDDAGAIGGQYAAVIDLPGGARVTIPTTGTATITHNDATSTAMGTTEAAALGSGSPADVGPVDRVGPYGEQLSAPDLDPDTATPTYLWHAATRADTLPGSAAITIVGARGYLPAIGEFLTVDPVIDSGQNLYGYTDGDPINTKDSSGNESETDWTWVWVAAGAAALSIALGVGNNFVKVNATKFTAKNVKWNAAGTKVQYFSAVKEVFRSTPSKAVIAGAMVISGVAAGVATGMALRNQVSETWQAVAIGVGAAVATVALAAGASFVVAKLQQRMALRKARLASASQPPRPASTSSIAEGSNRSSSMVDDNSGQFALKRQQNVRWSQDASGNAIFINQGSGERIVVNDLIGGGA